MAAALRRLTIEQLINVIDNALLLPGIEALPTSD